MRFLIIEDHPVFRKALKDSLADQFEGAEFIEFGHERDFPRSWDDIRADFAIVDLELYQAFQTNLIETLHQAHPDMPVLVVSMYGEAAKIRASLEAGARGFVTKHDPPDMLLTAIDALLNGETYLSERASAALVEAMQNPKPAERNTDYKELFTKREYEVFTKMGEGFSRKEAADQLNIALPTLETHIDRMKKKLDIHSGHDLAYMAIKHVSSLS